MAIMNTKKIMTLSALILGIVGIVLTFVPEIMLSYLNLETNNTALFLMQILGALYFAFGMLNWMSKAGLIGGIYNRPIAVANFTHFLIAGIALTKGLISNPDLQYSLWMAGIIYMVFALLFGIILFRHPISENMNN